MEEDNIRREEEEKKKAAVADNDDDKTSSNIKIVSTKSSSGKIMFNITEMLKLKELCTEKPSELDKVSFEIIKVAPSLMKQHSGFGNKGSFKNKQGQNWQSGRGRGRAQQTSTIVVEKLKVSENAWKPSLGKTEDADPVDITVKKVNSILNKLTLEMFDSLSSKMLEIPITSMRMLAGVVGAIFDKALSEPKFGELYAMFCKKLVEYRKDKKWDFVKVIKQEDGQFYWTNAIDENDKEFELKGPYADKKDAEDKGRKATEFKRALLNRCQHEFEKENEIIAAVEKVAKLKEELETMKANKESDEKLSEIKVKIQESNYVALKTKRLRLGNIQFIGELYKLELLSDNVMHGCILKILYKEENNRLVHYIPEEDDLEVLIKLLTTMGSLFDGKNRGNSKKDASNFERMNQYCARLGEIANSGQIPLRQKFLILNFLELRKNHWKARHEELKAKTIAEIQKDAKKEAASKAQQSSINNSNHNRGGNNQNQQRSWNNNQNKGSQRGGMSIAGANTGMSTGAFGHKLGKPQGASTGLGGGIGKSSIGGRIGQSSSMRSIGARPGANNSPIGITRPSQTSSVGGRNISPIASSTQKTPKLSKEKAERRAEGFLNEWIINKDKNALTLDIKELLEEAGKEVGMACLFKKACFLLIDKHKTTNVAIPKALIHGFETKYITTRDFENALDEEIKATIDEDLPMAEAYIADMIALFYNENILKASSIALVCRKYIEVNKEDSEHLIKSLLGKIFRALKSKAEAKAKAEIDSFGLKGLLGGDENVVKEFLDKYFF